MHRTTCSLNLAAVLLLLAGRADATPLPGRDFVPTHYNGHPVLLFHSNGTLLDAINTGDAIWVLYADVTDHDFYVQKFDPATGGWTGSATKILSPDGGGVENCINSAQIGLCAAVAVSSEAMTHITGTRWSAQHIGINPSSITMTGTGGTCSPTVTGGSFIEGQNVSGTYTNDTWQITGGPTCTAFYASYNYTNCSFDYAVHDAYRCPMYVDPTHTGFCKLMMLYEADETGDCTDGTSYNRRLMLANAQEIDGDWVKFLPTGATHPGDADARIKDTSGHEGGTANGHSFTSVPTMIRDPNDHLWRAWFVSEDGDGATPSWPGTSIRYTESDDDGLNWGIGGVGCNVASYDCGTVNCWNGSAFNAAACLALTWATAPPDDTTNTPYRNPDVVDPEVLPLDPDGDSDTDLGMMFTGVDRQPTPDTWGVQLFAYHQTWGNQYGSTYWTWQSAVQDDATDGVVMDFDNSCSTALDAVMDPEIVRVSAGKYLMFYNVSSGGFSYAASGYQCSDFVNNGDADGLIDYGSDFQCDSPSDDSE